MTTIICDQFSLELYQRPHKYGPYINIDQSRIINLNNKLTIDHSIDQHTCDFINIISRIIFNKDLFNESYKLLQTIDGFYNNWIVVEVNYILFLYFLIKTLTTKIVYLRTENSNGIKENINEFIKYIFDYFDIETDLEKYSEEYFIKTFNKYTEMNQLEKCLIITTKSKKRR